MATRRHNIASRPLVSTRNSFTLSSPQTSLISECIDRLFFSFLLLLYIDLHHSCDFCPLPRRHLLPGTHVGLTQPRIHHTQPGKPPLFPHARPNSTPPPIDEHSTRQSQPARFRSGGVPGKRASVRAVQEQLVCLQGQDRTGQDHREHEGGRRVDGDSP